MRRAKPAALEMRAHVAEPASINNERQSILTMTVEKLLATMHRNKHSRANPGESMKVWTYYSGLVAAVELSKPELYKVQRPRSLHV